MNNNKYVYDDNNNEIGYSCMNCNKNIIWGIKYQCIICEDVELCNECIIKTHTHHEFLKRD